MLNRKYLYTLYVIFAMLVIALCGCFAMQTEDGEDLGHLNMAKVYLATFVVLIPGVIAYFTERINIIIATPIKLLTLLLIWMASVSIIHSPNIKTAIYPCMSALIPLAALQIMYLYTRKYGINKILHWTFVAFQIILIAQYVRIYKVANMGGEAHLMTSYYPMFVLPLVLLHPRKLVRYISILTVVFIIFSSVKRGGMVALILGLVVYVISNRKVQSKGFRSILYMLFSFALLGGVFYYIANSEYGGVFERFESVMDDGGSGRNIVWFTTWQMIRNSEGASLIFGHGNNGVLNDSPVFLSAHNDFLESCYDYGLVGFTLYALSILMLIIYSIRLLKNKSELAPSMLMLLTITIILTNISHVLIFYLMTIVCMTIGTLMGQDTHNRLQIQRE